MQTKKLKNKQRINNIFIKKPQRYATKDVWITYYETQNAITIISLIITIIILIILAGVTISLTLGKNGIFNEAEYAVKETDKQTATEKINLKIAEAQMIKYAEEQRMPTLKELSVVLGNDNEIEYVTESSQIASTRYEVGDNPTSIYTKLYNYPYEFEINSSLQLASINGIETSNIVDNSIQINQDTLEIIGTSVGSNIVIPAGYKYVIISNGYMTTGSTNVNYGSKLNSNNNSEIIINKDSNYSYKYGKCSIWLIVAKITDPSQEATFKMNGSDVNVVFGIK